MLDFSLAIFHQMKLRKKSTIIFLLSTNTHNLAMLNLQFYFLFYYLFSSKKLTLR